MAARYVYGPVASRRFGLSLGIDPIPFKTCCYDCVYCQLGPTAKFTLERRDYAPVAEILGEVNEALNCGPRPEILTLAGSGEPTLHAKLREIIDGLHQLSDLPVALLTNGALLWDQDVAAAAAQCEIVAPSLDAADPETWRRIDRPIAGLDFEQMLSGIKSFCENYRGQLRLEIMLLKGVNDTPEALAALAGVVSGLRVDKIDLNLPVRPPLKGAAALVVPEVLAAFVKALGPRAQVIAPDPPRPSAGQGAASPVELRRRLLAVLARRPSSLDDLQLASGVSRGDLIRELDALLREGLAVRQAGEIVDFYQAKPQ